MIPVGLPWSFISFCTCKLRQLDGLSKCQQRTTSGWGKGHVAVAVGTLGPLLGYRWSDTKKKIYKMAKLSMGICGAISQFHPLYTQKKLISNMNQKTCFLSKKKGLKLSQILHLSRQFSHTPEVFSTSLPPLVASKTRPVRSCNPRLSRIQCCAAPAEISVLCFEGDPKIVTLLVNTGWWFQPILKIWVKLEIFPK